MNGISLGFCASSSCWEELPSSATPCSVSKSDSCWDMTISTSPRWRARRARLLAYAPVSGRLIRCHASSISMIERPEEQRRARAARASALCAFQWRSTVVGDVLHDREHHEPQLGFRAAARVEHDQRRVGAARSSRGRAGRRRCPRRSTRDRRSARLRSVAATSTASWLLCLLRLGAQLVLEHRLARLAARQRGRLGVDGADRGADHPDLPARPGRPSSPGAARAGTRSSPARPSPGPARPTGSARTGSRRRRSRSAARRRPAG